MPVQAAATTTGLLLLNSETVLNPSAPERGQTMGMNIVPGLTWSMDTGIPWNCLHVTSALSQNTGMLCCGFCCSIRGPLLPATGSGSCHLLPSFLRASCGPLSINLQVPGEELRLSSQSPSCCNWKAHKNWQSSLLMAASGGSKLGLFSSCQRLLS